MGTAGGAPSGIYLAWSLAAVVAGVILSGVPRPSFGWMFRENTRRLRNQQSKQNYRKQPHLPFEISPSLIANQTETSNAYREKSPVRRHDEGSLARAADHIQAILALAVKSRREQQNAPMLMLDEQGMYASILLTTLDNVIDALLREPEMITSGVLEQVDNLTETLFQFRPGLGNENEHFLVPSSDTLHSLWMVYQYGYRNFQSEQSQHNSTISRQSFIQPYISNCLRLLTHWRGWAFEALVSPPPDDYLRWLVSQSAKHHVCMTQTLWELCTPCIQQERETEHNYNLYPRELFSNLLQILSSSTSNSHWQEQQTQICRQMTHLSAQFNRDELLPTHDELWRALASSSSPQDSSWLLRAMISTSNLTRAELANHPTFLKTLQDSTEEGSQSFLKRIITHFTEEDLALANKRSRF